MILPPVLSRRNAIHREDVAAACGLQRLARELSNVSNQQSLPITVLQTISKSKTLGHDSGLKVKTDDVGITGCGVCNEVHCVKFQKSSELKAAAVGQALPHLI